MWECIDVTYLCVCRLGMGTSRWQEIPWCMQTSSQIGQDSTDMVGRRNYSHSPPSWIRLPLFPPEIYSSLLSMYGIINRRMEICLVGINANVLSVYTWWGYSVLWSVSNCIWQLYLGSLTHNNIPAFCSICYPHHHTIIMMTL